MSNNGQQKDESVIGKAIKDKVKKKTAKAAQKAIKRVAKKALKVAAKVILAAIKSLITFLMSVLGPYVLIAIAVIFAIFIIFLATTLIFSDSDDLTGDSAELQSYIKEKAKETVDQDKPEQLLYQVPYQLIIAAMQLYEAEKNGASSKEAVDIIADALKPEFKYEKKEGKIETISTTCIDGSCTSTTSEQKFKLTFLVEATAWDKKMTATLEKVTGDWVAGVSTSSTSSRIVDNEDGTTSTETTTVTHSTTSRAHTYVKTDTVEEDYYYFDKVLMGEPFNYGQQDMDLIDALYSATGGTINYTTWKNGESFFIGGYSGDLNVLAGSNVPQEFMQYYLGAQKKFGVDWYYVAAIHWVETKFSTHKPMVSSVGAEGHTQFMRCTWHGWRYPGCKGSNGHVNMNTSDMYNTEVIKEYSGYGIDADGNGVASPWDIADALYTTASYLARSGFTADINKSIYAYNHSDEYVQKVNTAALAFKDAATYSTPGGNPSAEVKNGFTQPSYGRLSSGWGYRTIGGTKSFHPGIDVANAVGTPIYAVAEGTIKTASGGCAPTGGYYGNQCGGEWGNYIKISHKAGGQPFEAVYAHLATIVVQQGQTVKAGDLIGMMGHSGSSTGSHVHFELHKGYRNKYANAVNPLLYIPAIKNKN